jgi:hypothetical protein
MSDRKNIKVREDTFDLLADGKRKMETWDSYLRRLRREAGDD